MTRQKIAEQYTINEQGIITSPGKFEGEMYYAVSYWGEVLDGFSDDDQHLDDGRVIAVFDIDKFNIEEFPELEGCSILRIWEDDNGFVFCEVE